MTGFLPRRVVIQYDPLTEHLQNLQPEQVDALEMMQAVYSNQASFAQVLLSMQRNIFETDNDIYELAKGVAGNTLPRLQAVVDEVEKQEL